MSLLTAAAPRYGVEARVTDSYRARDAAVARQVADVLRLRDPDLLASARLWKFLLEDLHPGLRVELDETRRDIGV